MAEIFYKTRYYLLLTVAIVAALCSVQSSAHEAVTPDSSASDKFRQQTRLDILPAGDYELEQLSAKAWIMVDGRTGNVLSQKNSSTTLYPASMTKMMTCILAIESGRLNDTVEISRNAAATAYGKVRTGERYILRDLLDVMMLVSDNGAATAVGEFLAQINGTSMANLMNAKAKVLQMNNSHFVNAHGLHSDDHYSTPADMMLLERYCMANPTFAAIVRQSEKDVPLVSPAGRVRHCNNTNKLLTTYNGAVGCKTGYTRPAGGCLASCAVRDELQLFLVVMNCTPARARMAESETLLDKGFVMAQQALAADRRRVTSKPPVPKPAAKPHQSQKPVPERRRHH
mgnify:CR=1 FL=1